MRSAKCARCRFGPTRPAKPSATLGDPKRGRRRELRDGDAEYLSMLGAKMHLTPRMLSDYAVDYL